MPEKSLMSSFLIHRKQLMSFPAFSYRTFNDSKYNLTGLLIEGGKKAFLIFMYLCLPLWVGILRLAILFSLLCLSKCLVHGRWITNKYWLSDSMWCLFGSLLEIAKWLLLPFCTVRFDLPVKCFNLNFPLITGHVLNPGGTPTDLCWKFNLIIYIHLCFSY